MHFWCFPPPLGTSELLFVSKKWEEKAQPLPGSCSPLCLNSSPFAFRNPWAQEGQNPTLQIRSTPAAKQGQKGLHGGYIQLLLNTAGHHQGRMTPSFSSSYIRWVLGAADPFGKWMVGDMAPSHRLAEDRAASFVQRCPEHPSSTTPSPQPEQSREVCPWRG